MKKKVKYVLVISIVISILLNTFPTSKIVKAFTEEEEKTVKEKYLDVLSQWAEAITYPGSSEDGELEQFNALIDLLDIWYETGENSSMIEVVETEVTNTDEEGNATTEIQYNIEYTEDPEVLFDIATIFNVGIMSSFTQDDVITYYDHTQDQQMTINASTFLGNMLLSGNNQLFESHKEQLENHLMNTIKPELNLDESYVPRPDRLPQEEDALENVGMFLTGIAKVLYYPIKLLVFLIPGGIIQVIVEMIASTDGGDSGWATLDRILFNEISITNPNIFDRNNAGNATGTIRGNIASWYMALRNLAIVIQLCVLIYVGIRMAISTVAEQKAKYKDMLKNWFIGMILLFLLHYFMVIVLNINQVLVNAIRSALGLDDSFKDVIGKLVANSMQVNIIKSTAAAMCFLMINGITFGYLIMYIKRMLTISLLTFIAPLITTTYAIDKIGDKKSQVLDTWIREYAYNVLIQPFHCIIYAVFIRNAVSVLAEAPESLAGAIIAVMCMSFMFVAEGIIKSIFGFRGATMSSAATSIAAFTAGATAVASFGSKVKNAESQIKENMAKTANIHKTMPKLDSDSAPKSQKEKSMRQKLMAGAGKVAGGAKNLYLNPKLTGIQMAMLSGTLSLTQGDGATALQTTIAGKKAGDTLGAHVSEKQRAKQVQRNEKMFERAFDEYQVNNPGVDMRSMVQTLANLKDGDIPEGQEHMAAMTRGLVETYRENGSKDPIKEALNYVDDLLKYQ